MSLILLKKSPPERDYKGELRYYGLCKCSFCLKEFKARLDVIKRQQSCGCMTVNIIKETTIKHGEGHGTRLYKIWDAMKQRCYNPSCDNYPNYGGRGITICPEWTDKLNGYINFRNWVLNNGYKENLQINRINNNGNYEPNNGNYEPNNCNFVTSEINNQNQSTTKLNIKKVKEIREKYIPYVFTVRMLSKEYNIAISTVYQVIKKRTWRNI